MYLWMGLLKTPPEPVPDISPVDRRYLTPVGCIGVNAFCLSPIWRGPGHLSLITFQLSLGFPAASVLFKHLVSSNSLSLSGERLCHIPSYITLDYTNSAHDVLPQSLVTTKDRGFVRVCD